MKQPNFTKVGFLKSYVLPAIVIFLIPGFGLWFFDHVEKWHDTQFRDRFLAQIRADGSLTQEQKQKGFDFYQRVPVSKILASNKPELKPLQDDFKSVKTRYAIFRWMKRAGKICLETGLFTFVAVGIGVMCLFTSQKAQYWSLRFGWMILRPVAVIQVVCQGALALALSYWVTAFYTESYYPKLVLVAGLFAIIGVLALIKAIFTKLRQDAELEGQLLTKEAAPELWQRVTEMAAKLGITPPDQIFIGIDDNFFVTEHPVTVGDKKFTGRTLFASISMLKTMTRSEADGVLAHELAHFSGEDTLYSKRISPLLGKYGAYLTALYQGGISRPVFHFMHLFWNLYQLSLRKISREREFRADRIGGEMTSPDNMSRALVKVAAYCRYRARVQRTLFGTDAKVQTMNVSERLEKGFPDFITACVGGKELAESRTPHPFDTHPPLSGRITNLGLQPETILHSVVNLPAVSDSWFSAIENAAIIEAEQWKQFEDRFHKAHEESLAWRFKPEGEKEIEHVTKYFPAIEFKTAKGATIVFTYENITASEWGTPIAYASISKCRREESWGRQRLIIEYHNEDRTKIFKVKLAYKDYKRDGADILKTFERYYGRHLTAKKYAEAKAAGKVDEPEEDDAE
ncbi:MAG: M48 family metallopeptidase [Limisphaerales bacterium]